MSRRSRSPVKLPSLPKFVAKILSSVASSRQKHRVIPDASLEAAVKQISNSLVNFDFDRFFTLFGPHTAVYRFVETLDFEAFRDALSKAFPARKIDSSEIHGVIDAKKNLENDLVSLDRMFEQMENKGLDVDSIRTSLAWVLKRNNETYPEPPASPASEPSSHGTLSESSEEPSEGQWYSGQFLEIPPQSWLSHIPNTCPDEVTTFTIPVPEFDPAKGWPKSASNSSQSVESVSQPLADHDDSGDLRAVPFPTGQEDAATSQTCLPPRSRCESIRSRRASTSSSNQTSK